MNRANICQTGVKLERRKREIFRNVQVEIRYFVEVQSNKNGGRKIDEDIEKNRRSLSMRKIEGVQEKLVELCSSKVVVHPRRFFSVKTLEGPL